MVALAGDNTTSMRLTSSGTLLLPPGRDGSIQPIVPMGAIIEQLGYKLIWSAGSCKLYPPDGRSIRLRVKNWLSRGDGKPGPDIDIPVGGT